MKKVIETERLILRELLPTDVEGIFELDSDPEVHQYLGNNPIKTREEAAEAIAFIRQQYTDLGIGRWAIIDKQTNEFIGWSGLKLVTDEYNKHSNYYDLGYRLIKKYWGKGIATETAKAWLHYAFETLKVDAVYAMTDCGNAGSDKILKKVGLQLVESFVLDEIMHNWYTIDRESFEKNQ
ncbi:GNAT family N-acetyltransferase [Pseudopedobacter beijingensis]|uniref:GNAT family N-acetyltransferase n=1 Tax=Pseudopedobacter beijingensis TaxID=1207056 RepID=A0ABW4ID97_9SPHI